MQKNPDEIGALWVKTSQSGTEYMTGTINNVKVVAFRTRKTKDSQPDWRVMVSKPRGSDGEQKGS